MSERKKPGIAIIGIGRWGQNLLREFAALENQGLCKLEFGVSRGNIQNLTNIAQIRPNLPHTTNYDDVLGNKKVDAVVIATPTNTHYQIIKDALGAEKHVFVEKPPTETFRQAEELLEIAKAKNRILITDNIFLYHPLIIRLKELLDNQKIKEAFFDLAKWGSFDGDIFADLAYHDIYTAIYLFGSAGKVDLKECVGIASRADRIKFDLGSGQNTTCHISINRYSPERVRNIVVKGDRETLIWTDKSLYQAENKGTSLNEIEAATQRPLGIICKGFISKLSSPSQNYDSMNLAVETLRIVNQLQQLSKRKK